MVKQLLSRNQTDSNSLKVCTIIDPSICRYSVLLPYIPNLKAYKTEYMMSHLRCFRGYATKIPQGVMNMLAKSFHAVVSCT